AATGRRGADGVGAGLPLPGAQPGGGAAETGRTAGRGGAAPGAEQAAHQAETGGQGTPAAGEAAPLRPQTPPFGTSRRLRPPNALDGNFTHRKPSKTELRLVASVVDFGQGH